MLSKIFQRVSESPTNPTAKPAARAFDVADLYRGPVAVAAGDGDGTAAGGGQPLDEKLRQAYFWIVNSRRHQPVLRHRVQRRRPPAQTFTFGDAQAPSRCRAGRATRASCCCRC
jgi:hypothetical protein